VAHSNTLLLEPEIWRVIYPDFVQGFSKKKTKRTKESVFEFQLALFKPSKFKN